MSLLEDPREALSRMRDTASQQQLPEHLPYTSARKSKSGKSNVPARVIEESPELPTSSHPNEDGVTSNLVDVDATPAEDVDAKKAKKAVRKSKKPSKKAAKENRSDATEVVPETQADPDTQLQEENLANLLQQHQQQQEEQEQQQQQQQQRSTLDGDAALAAQVLAESALRGRVGETPTSFPNGARVAPMMGFAMDQANIDPMLREPEEDLSAEDLQRRQEEMQAWLLQHGHENGFAQGAPQVPGMTMQGGLGLFDGSQQHGNIAELAAAAEQVTEGQEQAAAAKAKAKGGRKKKTDGEPGDEEISKKRKRRTSDEGEEGEETVAPKKRGKKAKAAEAQEDEDVSDSSLPTSGPFIKAEIKRIERIAELFMEQNGISRPDLNDLVQNKSREKSEKRDMFWSELYDALPHRQHVAIQRTTRRRYHNFEARGKWKPEEDEMLRQQYESQPQRWVAIGSALGRMPEDCRDRWRNYLACGDTKRTEDWTQKEEMELQMIVQELASAIRRAAKEAAKEKGTAFREMDWDTHVNFNTVSEKMNHTRSRLQCYQHWRIMQAREEREEQGIGRSAKALANAERAASGAPKNEWRRRQAVENVTRMTLEDKLKIVTAVSNSETLEEAMIPWRLLKKQDPTADWSTMDRKVAFQQLKHMVPRQTTLAETCAVVIDYLNEWIATDVQPPVVDPSEWAGDETVAGDGLTTVMGEETEIDGMEDGSTKSRKSKKSLGSGSRDSGGKWRRKAKLSEAVVGESEEEADGVDGGVEDTAMEQDDDDTVYRSAVSGQDGDGDNDSVLGEELNVPYVQQQAAVAAMM